MMTRDNNAASGCVFGLIACLPVWAMLVWALWRLLK
jgi:hypothetical protein